MSSRESCLREGYGEPREIREGQNNRKKIKLMKNRSSLTLFTTMLSVVACFGVLAQMQATLPPQLPNDSIDADGCYPAFNTAEGCSALRFVDAGIGDTGVGWFSLFLVGDGSFNTGLGAGALAINSPVAGVGANDNTAVGTGAMLLNINGSDNVAVGIKPLPGNKGPEGKGGQSKNRTGPLPF